MTIVAHVEARDLIKYADPKYYWRYDNKTVQRLIAAGDAAQTNTQWIADYREVERIITQAAVNDWLFLLPSLEVVRTGITGYPRNSLSLSFDITALRRD
jgi:peptide/nickel transport system substrate-binding protein